MADLFLLDANVFITAHASYYPMDRVPQYWDWLAKIAIAGDVKTPIEIFTEVKPLDNDKLFKGWLKENKKGLVLSGQDYQGRIAEVSNAYGLDLTERDFEKMAQDPVLIAAALELGATVVTKEESKPSKQKGNRKIPDVCDALGVPWINDHQLIRVLDFKIS